MPRAPRKPVPPPPGYVWTPEAARRLGVTISTLYKWRQTGHGPQAVPHGRKLMYRIADIDHHLDRIYRAATAPNPESRAPELRRTPARAAA